MTHANARMPDLREYLMARVTIDQASGCWTWNLNRSPTGYGRLTAPQSLGAEHRTVYAHRLAYEAFIASIPAGLDIDHLCRNRSCINPAHLEPVTRRENLLRGETVTAVHAARTHCPQGHPYDQANTYYRPDGTGRGCRKCRGTKWTKPEGGGKK